MIQEITRKHLFFPSGAIELEALLGHAPGRECSPAVIICHPHPEMGGSMENNVVYALFDVFVNHGYVALAFNFRGTGKSGGQHGGGEAEVQDVLAAVEFIRGLHPDKNTEVALAGYSFGAWVGLMAASRSPETFRCAGAVAPPLTMLPFDFLEDYPGPLFMAWGSRDGFCPSRDADRWIRRSNGRFQGMAVAGADHFFVGREAEAAHYLCDCFDSVLPG